MNMAPRKRPRLNLQAAIILSILCVLSQPGCGPTYPKEFVDEAVMQLCREEYKTEVKVEIAGNSIGVYIPIEDLFAATLSISEKAAKKINDVILSVSRVTLSTDAAINFYIVIAQDPKFPEIEVVLIRYVKDLKMLHYSQISRGEFSKRMLVDIKLTPQIQKEKVLREVFGRLKIEGADELVEEYLRETEVTTIGDIGYWNNTFYIKDINLSEFLALQIADRTKAQFLSVPDLRENLRLNSIKGEFLHEGGKTFFNFSFDITPIDTLDLYVSEDARDNMFSIMVKAAADTLHGYKFKDYWNIEVKSINDNQVLFATQEELEGFRKNKVRLEDLRRWYK